MKIGLRVNIYMPESFVFCTSECHLSLSTDVICKINSCCVEHNTLHAHHCTNVLTHWRFGSRCTYLRTLHQLYGRTVILCVRKIHRTHAVSLRPYIHTNKLVKILDDYYIGFFDYSDYQENPESLRSDLQTACRAVPSSSSSNL